MFGEFGWRGKAVDGSKRHRLLEGKKLKSGTDAEDSQTELNTTFD